MATINLGKIKPLYKGTYSAGVTYRPLDFVLYNTALYICKQQATGVLPTATAYFDPVVPAAAGGITNTPTGTITAVTVQDALNQLDSSKAPKDSPTFTGTPRAPTQATTDNGTQVVNSSWVRTSMGNIASAAGFAISLGATNYIKFPSWLGGWIVQWGSSVLTFTYGVSSLAFPVTFPTQKRMQLAALGDNHYASLTLHNADGWGTNPAGIAFRARRLDDSGAGGNFPDGSVLRIEWLAIGN